MCCCIVEIMVHHYFSLPVFSPKYFQTCWDKLFWKGKPWVEVFFCGAPAWHHINDSTNADWHFGFFKAFWEKHEIICTWEIQREKVHPLSVADFRAVSLKKEINNALNNRPTYIAHAVASIHIGNTSPHMFLYGADAFNNLVSMQAKYFSRLK